MYTSKDIIKCRLIDYIVEAIVEYEIIKVPERFHDEEKRKLENKWNLKFKNVKEFDNIVDELFDTDAVVHGLPKKNASILRVKMGIYNDVEEVSFDEVSKETGIPLIYCRTLFRKSIWTLRNRVIFYIENDTSLEDNILNKSIYYLDLSPQIYRPLYVANIKTIGDVISMDKDSLMGIGGIGRKLAEEIKNKVNLVGLKLHGENNDVCNTDIIVESYKNINSPSIPKVVLDDKYKLKNEELREKIKSQDKYICELEKKLTDYTKLLNEAKVIVESLEKSIKVEEDIIEELYNQNSDNKRLARNIKDNIDKILDI